MVKPSDFLRIHAFSDARIRIQRKLRIRVVENQSSEYEIYFILLYYLLKCIFTVEYHSVVPQFVWMVWTGRSCLRLPLGTYHPHIARTLAPHCNQSII